MITRWRRHVRCAGVLLAALVLHGCQVDPVRREALDELTASVRETALTCASGAADACAIPSPLRDWWQRVELAEGEHGVVLLETGPDALLARIHALRAARHTIDVQVFKLVHDDAGRLFMDELLAAARRGVTVRLLVDQLYYIGDVRELARFTTAHANLRIRLYNPTFGEARTNPLEFFVGVTCCWTQFNHRMHNKVIVVDDYLGIVGGRNIENRYFDWHSVNNFIDRDVLVVGPVARAMKASFFDYWRHPRTVKAEYLSDVSQLLLSGRPLGPLEWQPEVSAERVASARSAADDYDEVSSRLSDRMQRARKLAFFADPPAKTFADDVAAAAEVSQRLREILNDAQERIVIQTPYLVITRPATRLFKRLRKRQPEVDVYISTNSLASTDAYAVYAMSHKHKKKYVRTLRFRIHEMKPRPEDLQVFTPGWRIRAGDAEAITDANAVPILGGDERVTLHGKSFVIDGEITLVGSHNFDPRSDTYNTEAGLIIWDEGIAGRVEDAIRLAMRPRNAWVIAPKKKIPIISFFSGLIGNISRALPVLDVWPFRYTTSYELREGAEPVAPYDPAFHQRYHEVGDFPEVALSFKQIQTRFISAFGGLVTPIL